jgi:hypothetical protein
VLQQTTTDFVGAEADRDIWEITSSLQLWSETLRLPSTGCRAGPEAEVPIPLPMDESNPPAEKDYLESRQFIPETGAVAIDSLRGGRQDSRRDGMTVDLLGTNERCSTREEEGTATQERRSGNPSKKRPGKGTKPNWGDAKHSLLGGQGVATSTVSGTCPPTSAGAVG